MKSIILQSIAFTPSIDLNKHCKLSLLPFQTELGMKAEDDAEDINEEAGSGE
jgi:hypothetical protein